MRSITAIELGQDSCVLARIRRNRAVMEVSAVHGVREGEGALPDVDRGAHLRRLRRKGRFPRRARVVGWSLEEGAAPSDPLTRAALAPLLEAGFVLDAVMTPPEALAALARSRPRAAGRGATAWLSLNRHAAAIAIVNGGDRLFSRVFSWNYRPSATLREELLQRYSLVAHLAPELRHGFDVVRGSHGVTVDGIVTCGDLPDLRSLTMPLIEELDMEVETLDSLDGLEIAGAAKSPELADRAPALRLACAAAAGRVADRAGTSRLVMAAAAAVLVVVALWSLSWLWPGAGGDARAGNRPPDGSPVAAVQPAAPASSAAESQRASGPAASPRASAPVASPRTSDAPVQPASGAVPPPPAATSRSSSAEPAGAPPEPVEGGGGAGPPSVPAATTGQRGNEPAAVPVAPPAAEPRPPLPRPVPPVRPRIEAPQAATPRTAAPPAPGPRPVEPEPARPAAERPARKPVPLTAPLPLVNSILVAPERRLAVVDGAIVREGDRVGPRVLVRIEPAALILREPSGHEVRVPIRRRLGTDR